MVRSNEWRISDGTEAGREMTLEERVDYLENQLQCLSYLLHFHCGMDGRNVANGHPDLYERSVKTVDDINWAEVAEANGDGTSIEPPA